MPPKSKKVIEKKVEPCNNDDISGSSSEEEPKEIEIEPTNEFIEDEVLEKPDVERERPRRRLSPEEYHTMKIESRRIDEDKAKKMEETITGKLTTNELLKILMFRGKSTNNPVLFDGSLNLFRELKGARRYYSREDRSGSPPHFRGRGYFGRGRGARFIRGRGGGYVRPPIDDE